MISKFNDLIKGSYKIAADQINDPNAKLVRKHLGKAAAIIYGTIFLLVAAGFIIYGCIQRSENNDKQSIDMALAQNDFETAKSIARSLNNAELYRVVSAEIKFLIGEGEFELARQIADENTQQDKYYELLMPNLVTLYDKFGLDKVRAAVASCPLPVEDNYGDKYLGSLRFASYDYDKLSAFYTTHNEHLERLMEYMNMAGDKELHKIAIYLSNKCDDGDKTVAKIKAKFRLK